MPQPDRRPPGRGCAAKVAKTLDAAGVTPAQMSAYLREHHGVARFADLTYSMADAVREGLAKSTLLDVVRRYPEETP